MTQFGINNLDRGLKPIITFLLILLSIVQLLKWARDIKDFNRHLKQN